MRWACKKGRTCWGDDGVVRWSIEVRQILDSPHDSRRTFWKVVEAALRRVLTAVNASFQRLTSFCNQHMRSASSGNDDEGLVENDRESLQGSADVRACAATHQRLLLPYHHHRLERRSKKAPPTQTKKHRSTMPTFPNGTRVWVSSLDGKQFPELAEKVTEDEEDQKHIREVCECRVNASHSMITRLTESNDSHSRHGESRVPHLHPPRTRRGRGVLGLADLRRRSVG